jgi:WhiB family transcriptional regulator, redox-sensing transcriptional regulator
MTSRPGIRYRHQARTDRANWNALCHQSGENPELWFPDPNTHNKWTLARTNKAVAICKRCPIQQACRQYAIDTDNRYGIWGGLTEATRAELTGRRAAG